MFVAVIVAVQVLVASGNLTRLILNFDLILIIIIVILQVSCQDHQG